MRRILVLRLAETTRFSVEIEFSQSGADQKARQNGQTSQQLPTSHRDAQSFRSQHPCQVVDPSVRSTRCLYRLHALVA